MNEQDFGPCDGFDQTRPVTGKSEKGPQISHANFARLVFWFSIGCVVGHVGYHALLAWYGVTR